MWFINIMSTLAVLKRVNAEGSKHVCSNIKWFCCMQTTDFYDIVHLFKTFIKISILCYHNKNVFVYDRTRTEGNELYIIGVDHNLSPHASGGSERTKSPLQYNLLSAESIQHVSLGHGRPWRYTLTHVSLCITCRQETVTSCTIMDTQSNTFSASYLSWARSSANWQWSPVIEVNNIHVTPQSWQCCHVKLYNLLSVPDTSSEDCLRGCSLDQSARI